MAKRNDLGAPVDGYFTQQPPFYQRNGKSVCSLAAFKEHVGINFFAPPTVLVDPGRKLEGGGKSMRMLKVRTARQRQHPALAQGDGGGQLRLVLEQVPQELLAAVEERPRQLDDLRPLVRHLGDPTIRQNH